MNNPVLNMYKDNKKRFGKAVKVIRADFTTFKTIAIIKEFDNKNNSNDDKRILFDVKDNIQQGDLIQYENNTYIILLQEESINNIYCKYVARRCDNKINIYIGKKLFSIPCNISTFTQDVFENAKIKLPSGNVKITMQRNNINNKIDYNMRFIIMGVAWKVVGYTQENKGLRYIYCEKTEFDNANDDRENEIADRWSNEVKHNYSMTVTEDNIILEEGKIKQLVINITDNINGKVETVVNPTIIYTLNNTEVIIVDNKGLIKAVKEGTSTIKITFENIEKIINVKVVKPLPITTTYSFKTITLDNTEFTGDSITLDNGTSKLLKVTEITKTTTQGDKVTEEVISNPVVAYSSNNANVSMDNTGKLTGVAAGNSIITIGYENIKKDINITIADTVKLEITGKDELALGRTRTYNSNIPCTWSVKDVNNDGKVIKTWVTITATTDTSCTIKITDKWIFGNDNSSKYFKIIATSKDVGNVKAEKQVKIIVM